MAQICYYDPLSAGIKVQSPQSATSPRRLTLGILQEFMKSLPMGYKKKLWQKGSQYTTNYKNLNPKYTLSGESIFYTFTFLVLEMNEILFLKKLFCVVSEFFLIWITCFCIFFL